MTEPIHEIKKAMLQEASYFKNLKALAIVTWLILQFLIKTELIIYFANDNLLQFVIIY